MDEWIDKQIETNTFIHKTIKIKNKKRIFTFKIVRERKGDTSKAIRVTDDGGGGCITFKLCI